MTRRTSDHVPLKIDIATTIPRSNLFWFDNYWVNEPGFVSMIESAWACRTRKSDPAAAISAKLKRTRRTIKNWRKSKPNLGQQETDCSIVINLIDFVEEVRPLTWRETKLRALITTILSRVTQAKLTIWKQRSKIRAAIEGDENTRFFHACANQ
jgi:hypothetical protein